MEMLKKHAFTIIVVTATLAISLGTLMGITLPNWKANRQKISQHEGLWSTLMSLGKTGQPRSNVEKLKEFTTQQETEVKNAAEEAGKLNRQGRKSFSMNVRALNKTIDLFPVDRQNYEHGYIPLQFREVYDKAMSDLVAKLDGAAPPSADDIASEAQRIDLLFKQGGGLGSEGKADEILPLGVEENQMNLTGPAPAGPTARMPMGGGGGEVGRPMFMGRSLGGSSPMPMGRPLASPSMPGPAGATGAEVVSAGVEAEKRLKLQKIQNTARPMYADRSSFFFYPLVPSGAVPIHDMWKAMVCCWIQDYAIDAVQNTNKQAFERRKAIENPNLKLCIDTAAVKRIVRLSMGAGGDVLNNLYAGETGASASGGGGIPGFMPGRLAVAGPRGGGADTGAGAAATLTNHQCNTQYDVLRFGMSLMVRAGHPAALNRAAKPAGLYGVEDGHFLRHHGNRRRLADDGLYDGIRRLFFFLPGRELQS